MQSKCPGQDTRNLKAAMYKCPNCGNEVEMFSDELRIKCKKWLLSTMNINLLPSKMRIRKYISTNAP